MKTPEINPKDNPDDNVRWQLIAAQLPAYLRTHMQTPDDN
jgi:hypothetical protein